MIWAQVWPNTSLAAGVNKVCSTAALGSSLQEYGVVRWNGPPSLQLNFSGLETFASSGKLIFCSEMIRSWQCCMGNTFCNFCRQISRISKFSTIRLNFENFRQESWKRTFLWIQLISGYMIVTCHFNSLLGTSQQKKISENSLNTTVRERKPLKAGK